MKKILFMLSFMFFLSGNCSAENLIFVDARDATGYYYDAETLKIESPIVLSVRLAVIKADRNDMYVYDVTINHESKTYIINSSKIMSYDTRTVRESNNQPRAPRAYSRNSEMNATVNYILYENAGRN